LWRVRATIVAVEKGIIIIYREFVALGIQHVMRMRHVIICGLSGSVIFFHTITQAALISEKKVFENTFFLFSFYDCP
jgi:hypothetical protein